VIGETVPLEQWALMGQLRQRIKKAFDEEGIVIPYPQRTLHLDTAAALMGLGKAAGGPAAKAAPSSGSYPEPDTEARSLDDSPSSP
jgi:small conductance mechanosensitive channel